MCVRVCVRVRVCERECARISVYVCACVRVCIRERKRASFSAFHEPKDSGAERPTTYPSRSPEPEQIPCSYCHTSLKRVREDLGRHARRGW